MGHYRMCYSSVVDSTTIQFLFITLFIIFISFQSQVDRCRCEVKMVGKSPLWKHFDSVKYEGQKFARCKISEACQVQEHFVPIRQDCSTSGLWRHLSAPH